VSNGLNDALHCGLVPACHPLGVIPVTVKADWYPVDVDEADLKVTEFTYK
jgi:hypothetical protein